MSICVLELAAPERQLRAEDVQRLRPKAAGCVEGGVEHLLGTRPVAEAEESLCGISRQESPAAALVPAPARCRQPFERVASRLGQPAGVQQKVRKRDVGPELVRRRAALPCPPARVVQALDPLGALAEQVKVDTEVGERQQGGPIIPDRVGDRERLLASGTGLVVPPEAIERTAERCEHTDALGRGRLRRDQLDSPLERGQTGFAIDAAREQEPAEPLVQQANLDFVGRVGQGDRPPDELGGLPGGAREEGDLRSPGE